MDKIPIWKCDYCGNPACIFLRVDLECPDICPWSGNLSVFIPEEMEVSELFEYKKNYYLEPMKEAKNASN